MAALPRLLLSIALGAACALALAACGGDDDVGEIEASSAQVMLAALDEAQAAEQSDPRDCEAIAESASTVATEADGLPESEVRRAVIAAAENLHDLANSDECEPSGATGPEGPQEATETTTAPETTTTEQTTTTTTEKPPKPKPKPKPKPQPGNEGGGGLGQGNQGGQPPDTGGTGGGGTGPG